MSHGTLVGDSFDQTQVLVESFGVTRILTLLELLRELGMQFGALDHLTLIIDQDKVAKKTRQSKIVRRRLQHLLKLIKLAFGSDDANSLAIFCSLVRLDPTLLCSFRLLHLFGCGGVVMLGWY